MKYDHLVMIYALNLLYRVRIDIKLLALSQG